jgi:hypothetical protein
MDQSAWLGADCRRGRSIFRHHDCRLGVGRFVAALAALPKGTCRDHLYNLASSALCDRRHSVQAKTKDRPPQGGGTRKSPN